MMSWKPESLSKGVRMVGAFVFVLIGFQAMSIEPIDVPSLSLKAVSGDSRDGRLEIRPLSKSRGLGVMKSLGFKESIPYDVVRLVPGQGDEYQLQSASDGSYRFGRLASATLHRGTVQTLFEFFPRPNQKIKLVAESKAGDSDVESDFLRFEFPAEVDFNSLVTSVNSACGSAFEVSWGENLPSNLKSRSSHVFRAIEGICKSEKVYQDGLRGLIRRINFQFSSGKDVEYQLVDKVLKISLSDQPLVLGRQVSKWLKENL